MANYNINSGYGQVQANALSRDKAGKMFVVGASGLAYRSMYQELLPPDTEGRARFVSTIAAASALCTASGADVIYVLPGHTETISSATALTLSIVGIRVIGLGQGTDRPTITLDTATTATINVTANNISFENFIFVANFADIVALFTLTTAKNFTLRNVEINDTSSVLNFLALVSTDATSNHANGLTFDNVEWNGLGATTNTTVISMNGTNDKVRVKNSYFTHAAVTGGGFMIIATGKVVTNLQTRSNVFLLTGATSLTTGILITTDGSTNSGIISGNIIQGLDATTEILVTASSGFRFSQNFYSGVTDKSGYLLPAADA